MMRAWSKRVTSAPPLAQWGALIGLSIALSAAIAALGLPAALLLGPMLGGIVSAANGVKLSVAKQTSMPVQALIGCMVAKMIPPEIFTRIGAHWPLFLFGIVSVILACALLGWLLMRWRVLPGSTACGGSAPARRA